MNIKLVVLTLFLFFAGRTAFSESKYYLPQVAIGSFGSGGFRTTFLFFNNQKTAANIVLTLTNDAGAPMVITIPGLGTNSTFTFTLETGASRIYQTDVAGSRGPLKAGAAVVISDAPIGVSALFTIYDAQGNFVTEAGVGNSDPLTSFVIPVEITATYNTGLALYNPTATDSSITATLTNTDGTVAGRISNYPLNAGKHIGVYVTDLFSNISNFQGSLMVQSSVAISAMTLRQNASPLSYTSCPVVSTGSTQKTFVLAQVVNGASSDVGYKTSFMLINFSVSTATVTLTLTKDAGTPFPVVISEQGASAKSTFNFTIGAGKSLFLHTDGTGTLSQGAASITSDVAIGAAGIFTQYDSKGNFATEAGVQDSPALTDLTLPVDSKATVDTGIALFNPGTSPVTITPRFLDADGVSTTAAIPIVIPAIGHYAGFFGNIFPELGTIQGSFAISALTPISALTMRENFSPFGMTSLPVVSGSSPGRTLGPATGDPLPASQSGIDATTNVAYNKTLRPGYHLSGSIRGSVYPWAVTAQSGSNSYSDNVGFYPARYDIVLPAGTYTVKATIATAVSGQYKGTFIDYTYPTPVTVSDHTTLDINITPPALFSVSGSITGMEKISANSSFQLSIVSKDNTIIGYCPVTNGAYTLLLPAGDYTAGIIAFDVPSGGLNENMGIFNIGAIHISGNTTQNFAIPDLAILSGAASFPGNTPGAVTITAVDSSDSSDFSQISRTTILSAVSGFNGSYRMMLAKDRTYNMNISYLLSGGSVQFPLTASTVNLTQDSTYDFKIQALPAEVQINGKVVDNTGAGISSVTVAATSESLTGATDAGFAATTATDSNGNYSIKVLSGKYRLTFTPPGPRLGPVNE
jgi:hypothetical protein